VLELVLAVAAAVGCVASWLGAQYTVAVPPIADGEPATTAMAFYPPLLVLTFVLGTLAGVLAVVGVSRWRASRPARLVPVAPVAPDSPVTPVAPLASDAPVAPFSPSAPK
jgi:Flp pilus assembly protein CpaB